MVLATMTENKLFRKNNFFNNRIKTVTGTLIRNN